MIIYYIIPLPRILAENNQATFKAFTKNLNHEDEDLYSDIYMRSLSRMLYFYPLLQRATIVYYQMRA